MPVIAGRPETFLASSRPGADPSRLARGQDAGLIEPLGMRSTREVLETRAELDQLARIPTSAPRPSPGWACSSFTSTTCRGASRGCTTGAERLADPALRHFTWLNAGLALDAANRRPEAIEAYRRATEIFPMP